MICGPRIASSPISPLAVSVRPSSIFTIFASVFGIGMPMEPVLRSPLTGFMCVTGEAFHDAGTRECFEPPHDVFGHWRRSAETPPHAAQVARAELRIVEDRVEDGRDCRQ